MSDATLRQINGVTHKDVGVLGSSSNINLPLIEQLAGGKIKNQDKRYLNTFIMDIWFKIFLEN